MYNVKGLAIAAAIVAGGVCSHAWAMSGADALKQLNHDSDQTLEIPEVMDAASKLFTQLNPQADMALEHKETAGRVTAQDWKAVNKDHDNTLERDE